MSNKDENITEPREVGHSQDTHYEVHVYVAYYNNL